MTAQTPYQRIEIPYAPRDTPLMPGLGIHHKLETHRYAVLVAHRRFGKTVLSINHLIKMAVKCRRQHGSFVYIAPFRNQGKSIAWNYLKDYTAPFQNRVINETELSILIPSSYGDMAKLRIFGADNPDALRGQYFDCVVLDEVAQMKPDIWLKIIKPALTDRHGSALFIGTPNGVNLFSELFYYALRREAECDPEWCAMRFPADRTTLIPDADLKAAQAEDLNIYRQEYLCDFSASSQDALITLDEVQAAISRAKHIDALMHEPYPLVLGVDIARFGDDATVFFFRKGLVADEPIIYRNRSNTDVAHLLIAEIAKRHPAYVNIDSGQGTGVIDYVDENLHSSSTAINEIRFGSTALNSQRFNNRRSEMWTLMRDWIRDKGVLDVSKSAAENLKAELTAPTYTYDAASKICLEKKDAIKARLKRSPDIADALALTFAIEIAPLTEKQKQTDHYGRYTEDTSPIIQRSAREGFRPWER